MNVIRIFIWNRLDVRSNDLGGVRTDTLMIGITQPMNENKNQTIQWIIEVFMFMNLGNEVNGDLNGIGKIIIEGICHGYEIGIQYLFTALGTTG